MSSNEIPMSEKSDRFHATGSQLKGHITDLKTGSYRLDFSLPIEGVWKVQTYIGTTLMAGEYIIEVYSRKPFLYHIDLQISNVLFL